MWEQWKKTAWFIQALIVALVIVLLWRHVPVVSVLFLLLVLETASLFGAWWGARLKRRIGGRPDALPLQGRK